VHPTAFRDSTFCESDDRAVAQDGNSGGHVDQRDLVRFGDILNQLQPGIELRTREQTALVHYDGHRVVRVHLHVEGA
jgi:hypothetical protein